MALPPIVPRLTRLGLRILTVLSFVAPLVTRIVIGYGFHETGSGKLAHPDRVIAFFTNLGIPQPALNAAVVSRLEYYGGMAIMAGAGTRAASVALTGTMVVALMTADRESFVSAVTGTAPPPTEGEEPGEPPALSDLLDPNKVAPFPYLMSLLWLIFYGPGALSVDALVKRVVIDRKLLPEELWKAPAA